MLIKPVSLQDAGIGQFVSNLDIACAEGSYEALISPGGVTKNLFWRKRCGDKVFELARPLVNGPEIYKRIK